MKFLSQKKQVNFQTICLLTNTDFEALFKEYLVNLKINTNQYPDFKNDYYWKYIEKNNSDKLLVIINKNKTRLYIIQSLS